VKIWTHKTTAWLSVFVLASQDRPNLLNKAPLLFALQPLLTRAAQYETATGRDRQERMRQL
jgi:hypothetical protein